MGLFGVAMAVALLTSPAQAQVGEQTPTPLPTTKTVPPTTVAATTPPAGTSTTKKATVVTRPRSAVTTTTVPPSTTTVPPTTVASIPALAPPPSTLPLAFSQTSGHVSVFFPILGGIGLVALIGLLATQWFLTKPGRNGPTL